MSASTGSQLDIYLAQFDQSQKVAGPEKECGDNLDLSFNRLRAMKNSMQSIVSMVTNEALLGIWRDTELVMDLTSESFVGLNVALTASNDEFCVQVSRAHSQILHDILRRCILAFLSLWSGVSCLTLANQSLAAKLIYRARLLTFGVSTILIVLPIVFGILLGQWTRSTLMRTRRSERSTFSVIGWIKKMQLSSLGRQLTHPMPPISKIEEAAREQHGDTILSCPEMRKCLQVALQSLDDDIVAALRDFDGSFTEIENKSLNYSGNNIASSGELLMLSTAFFKHRIITSYKCILTHILPSDKYFMKCQREKHSNKKILSRLFYFLKLPIFLISINIALDQYQRKLNLLCREVNGYIITNDIKDGGGTDITDSIAGRNNESSHAATQSKFLAIRQNLLRYRLEIEGDLNKLWLCEQELSTVSATRIQFPNSFSAVPASLSSSSSSPISFSPSVTVSKLNRNQCMTEDIKQAVIKVNKTLEYMEELIIDADRNGRSSLRHNLGVDLQALVVLLSSFQSPVNSVDEKMKNMEVLGSNDKSKITAENIPGDS